MHIRRMRLSDIPDVIRICCEAFKDDGTFKYILPRLHEYPDDFAEFFRASCRKRMNQIGIVCNVAETDNSDPEGPNIVVGMTTWERVGDDDVARRWKSENRGPLKSLERGLQSAEALYLDKFIGNRAMDKKHMVSFFAAVQDNFPKEVFQDYWYLHGLAIDPRFQRRGIGGMLTTWGIDQARGDGVCATVEASVPGRPMYEKLGFRSIRTVCADPPGNSDLVPVLVWQPGDSKKDWVGRAKEHFKTQESEGKQPDDRGLGEKVANALGSTQAEVAVPGV